LLLGGLVQEVADRRFDRSVNLGLRLVVAAGLVVRPPAATPTATAATTAAAPVTFGTVTLGTVALGIGALGV
jgi:hypothetical protein